MYILSVKYVEKDAYYSGLLESMEEKYSNKYSNTHEVRHLHRLIVHVCGVDVCATGCFLRTKQLQTEPTSAGVQ